MLLLEGVKVNYKEDGKDKTDYVQLVDFANVSNNEYLVVNQYTITGIKGNRRPDLVVFVNGLPLAVIRDVLSILRFYVIMRYYGEQATCF